jgi:hypothetical protein
VNDLLVLRARIPDDGSPVDIEVEDGRISEIEADLCILNSYKLSDVIQDQPIRAAILKSGRIVVETELDTRYPTGMP